MAADYVKRHNGFIHVDCEPGKGATFRVCFPAVDAPPDRKASGSRGTVRGGDETILLAEDDESVRRLAERTLTSQGYRQKPFGPGALARKVREVLDGN